MIGLGLMLQRKISTSDHLKGLKVIILSIALPATIFAALLNVRLEQSLWLLPVFALAINGLMLLVTRLVKGLHSSLSSEQHRTMMMLLPSLAPGLSCFPFLMEYLGDDAVALAAVADVGNKVFVLIVLYLLAMQWHHQLYEKASGESRLKQLLLAMISEPINVVIIVAVAMVSLGWNLQSLPAVIGETILRLGTIMAPLILLFIGLAVKTSRKEAGFILQLLSWRAGVLLVFSGVIIALLPGLAATTALLLVVFPQSSVSFWPFAHMSAVDGMEQDKKKTFDINFALSLLAVSLPFSTLVMLGVFSFQAFFLNATSTIAVGVLFIVVGLLPVVLKRFRNRKPIAAVMTPHATIGEESGGESLIKAS